VSHKSPDKRPRRPVSRKTAITMSITCELLGVGLIFAWVPKGNLFLLAGAVVLILGGLITQARLLSPR
jgi:uncharacterized membrane protein